MCLDAFEKENKLYVTGLRLLHFEALCHGRLIQHLNEVFKKKELKPHYGCVEGRTAYIAIGYQLDAAVFLYESFKHFATITPQYASEIREMPIYKDLEIVRNNIHTYFKNGGFIKKTSSIIEANLVKYEMIEPDFLYSLRSDISLVFEIVGKKRTLIGSDYFVQHCIYESRRDWTKIDYKNFTESLSQCISLIAQKACEEGYWILPLKPVENLPCIELFDYKSADLFTAGDMSEGVIFRLILMLYQLSYGLILVEKIVDGKVAFQDDLWCCFLSKILAIKYDESFDNLESILRYSKKDSTKLAEYLDAMGLQMSSLKARKFAQNIRNTIHYQRIKFNEDSLDCVTIKDYIVAIYLSNAEVDNMNQFRNYSLVMIDEIKRLQEVIRNIISLDKTYEY